ncbi:MAG: hypothetical protein MJ146_00520 [Clostridia bacterium]|nr:hypothetical protein [Clostridia bacterium]
MDRKTRNNIHVIVSFLLLIAALIFVVVGLMDHSDSARPFIGALVCILLSNIFNLFRKKDK